MEMQTVRINFPHRDTQIESLWKLLCHNNVNEMVHVFGLPATGKTSVVRAVLETSQTPHVYINCHECSSARSLFERILSDISQLDLAVDSAPSAKKRRQSKSKSSDEGESFECRSGAQFIENYKRLCSKVKNLRGPVIVVLDNIERACRYSDGSTLPVLCRMLEFASDVNRLVLVTISDLPWAKLFLLDEETPLQVAFPGYSMEESLKVLEKMNPDYAADKDRPYRPFLKTALDIFYPSCRDILELDHQIRLLYTKWDGKSMQKSWCGIRQAASKQLGGLLLRNTGNEPHEMSKTSKYLLVAAFCASYNPKKSDKRFFLKYHGKERVQAPHSKRKTTSRSCLLTGPKPFPLERLLIMYRCLAKEDEELVQSRGVNITDQLLAQIAGLVNERLLQSISATSTLGMPKYKCMADFELVNNVAKSIDIELKQRLFDSINAF